MVKFTPSKYARRLPHFDIGQADYHLIFRLKEGHFSELEIEIVKKHIEEGNDKFYRLIAVQVMPNHVHLIVQPNENVKILSIIRGIKGATARKINLSRRTSGSLWSDKYFDRIIRNQDDLNKTLLYIEQNPHKVGLVDDNELHTGWKFIQE